MFFCTGGGGDSTARIIEIYDTVDGTDPDNPKPVKGIVHVRDGLQQIIFATPEELDAKIEEIKKL
ncbi:MAG: hypothetical protein J7K40_14315 [candidate division Zixibacteria bacterium]|nr:hypothetical protein [candidate division Zixibacteria bacterium]